MSHHSPHESSSGTVLIRRKKNVLKVVEDFDAFSKVPETCVETTSYGGGASVVAIVLILWLVGLELSYYLDTEYKFHFSPDTDLDAKLSINVDLTVAMPCAIVGADIVDSTNQNVVKFGELEEEYVHFELNDEQRSYFNSKTAFNTYFREEFHAINDILWKNNFINMYSEMPKLSRLESHERGPKEACRFHGSLELNKVAGNFHITAGKTLPLSRGHAHIAAFMTERDYNFSHRIYKFSFGDSSSSIVLPLEGDEKVAHSNHMLYTYFIQVVPTIVRTRFRTYQTHQYSVRELAREIDHEKGSHGVSGIFFKYDMSGLKVEVTEESESFIQLLIRLCAIIGGVYATVGMLYNHLSYLGCTVNSFRKKGKGRDSEKVPLYSNNDPKKIHSSSHSRTGSGIGSLNLDFQTADIDLIHPQAVPDSPISTGSRLSFSQNTMFLDRDGERLPDILSSHSKT